jgi:hypothetical protein
MVGGSLRSRMITTSPGRERTGAEEEAEEAAEEEADQYWEVTNGIMYPEIRINGLLARISWESGDPQQINGSRFQTLSKAQSEYGRDQRINQLSGTVNCFGHVLMRTKPLKNVILGKHCSASDCYITSYICSFHW